MGKIYKAIEKSRKEDKSGKKLNKAPNKRAVDASENTNGQASSEGDAFDLSAIHSLLDDSGEIAASQESDKDHNAPVPSKVPPEDTRSVRNGLQPGNQEPDNSEAAKELPARSKSREEQPIGKGKSHSSSENLLAAPDNEPSREQPKSDPLESDERNHGKINGSIDSSARYMENSGEQPATEGPPKTDDDDLPQKKIIRLRKQEKQANEAVPISRNTPKRMQALEETIGPAEAKLQGTDYGDVDKSLVTLLKPRSFEAEQFKLLRTNLLFPISGTPPRSILVTSALPGDGKSFVASNLAASFALNLDRRVMLIDADIRKPEIHKRFGIEGKRGLSDFLTKGTPLPSLLRRTSLNNLTILPAGRPPYNPSELLSSEKMPALLKEVTARYQDRYVIIDSPPPKLTSETSVLARMVDGILLVVRVRKTKRELVEELIEMLGKDKILGVVMNYYELRPSRYYGYGKYYGNYYGK